MRLFLYGDIGVGKSTFLRRMLEENGWHFLSGYATRWDGNRHGANTIWLESWDGSVRIPFAEKRETSNPADFPYFLHEEETLSGIQAACFSDVNIPLVIDELGIIEFQSPAAIDLIQKAVISSEKAVMIVQNRVLERWKSIFHTVEITWQPISLANRNKMPNLSDF